MDQVNVVAFSTDDSDHRFACHPIGWAIERERCCGMLGFPVLHLAMPSAILGFART
jgi:hypothetical protein